jgi:hypothetical protein
MIWLDNIDFKLVPEPFINQLRERSFSYEEYQLWADILNRESLIWNSALVDKEGYLKCFMYGNRNPLERKLWILRISVDPKLFTFKGVILSSVLDKLYSFQKKYKVERIYWETKEWKAYLRKIPNDIKVVETMRVMEVI